MSSFLYLSAVQCPSLAKPSFGEIYPDNCATDKLPFGSHCTFACRKGFKLQGPSFRWKYQNIIENILLMILDNVKEKGLGVVEGSWHDVLVIIIDDVKIMNKELTTIIRRGATDNKLSREQNSDECWEASLRLSGMAGPSNERWEHWALKPSRPQLFSSLQTIQDSFHFSPRFLLCISLWSSRLEWQQLGYGMLVARRVFWMKIPFIVFNFDLNVCSI